MSAEPKCYVDVVRFQQEADGYDVDANVQNLCVEVFFADDRKRKVSIHAVCSVFWGVNGEFPIYPQLTPCSDSHCI